MFYSIVSILCIIIFIVSVRAHLKMLKEFQTERTKFCNFLFSVNDIDMLRKLGEINSLGIRERCSRKPKKVLETLEQRIYASDTQNRKHYEAFYHVLLWRKKKEKYLGPGIYVSAGIFLQTLIDFLQGKIH